MSPTHLDPPSGTLWDVPGLLTTLIATAATLAGWWWLTLTLPEPDPAEPDLEVRRRLVDPGQEPLLDPDDGLEDTDPKRPYRDLATWRHASGVTLTSALATLTIVQLADPTTWPAWLVLSTFGVLLAGVDAFTTWIPKRVSHLSWAALAIAVAITAALHGPWIATAAGALVAAALFAGMWLGTRGALGFGDVRYIPLIGAPTMGAGWTVFCVALLIGSLLVLLHGLLRKARGRTPMVPWAPGYLIGALAALAIH